MNANKIINGWKNPEFFGNYLLLRHEMYGLTAKETQKICDFWFLTCELN